MIALLFISIIITIIQYTILGGFMLIDESPISDERSFWLWIMPLGMLITLVLYFINIYKNLNHGDKIG